jgi:rare lipoprotein A (peptidoglycan hydrolase)
MRISLCFGSKLFLERIIKKTLVLGLSLLSLLVATNSFARAHHGKYHSHHFSHRAAHRLVNAQSSYANSEFGLNTWYGPAYHNNARNSYAPAISRIATLASRRMQQGVASWYGPGFHLRRTASGEKYNMFAMTAASRTLPLLSYAKVTDLRTGRQITVKINDRGPYVGHRIIDLSYAAARQLGIVGKGTAMVAVEPVNKQERLA